MKFDKGSKSRTFFFGGGGGEGGRGKGAAAGEGDMNTRAAIFYTQDTLSLPLLQKCIVSCNLFLTVFKKEGIVALTIKGR